LRPFLEAGYDIEFRWIIMQNVEKAVQLEKIFLQEYDYALNIVENGAVRHLIGVYIL
jgi:hypothetical protein